MLLLILVMLERSRLPVVDNIKDNSHGRLPSFCPHLFNEDFCFSFSNDQTTSSSLFSQGQEYKADMSSRPAIGEVW